jgi:nitroreductase
LAEGTHIKYRALAHNLKLFYLSVPIDDQNSKLEGKLIAARFAKNLHQAKQGLEPWSSVKVRV